jgi:hypothetical protein
MKRLLLVAVACAFALSAAAQTITWSRLTFATVDAVRLAPSGDLFVTGLLAGELAPAEYRLNRGTYTGIDYAECRRLALVAMSKPGQYLLSFDASPATAYWYVRDCRLERAQP